MMSLDTHDCDIVGSRDDASGIKLQRSELIAFARWGARVDSDMFSTRVLQLAREIHKCEKEEWKQLKRHRAVPDFKAQLSPDRVSGVIVSGLARLLRMVREPGVGKYCRFTAPSEVVIKEMDECKEGCRVLK